MTSQRPGFLAHLLSFALAMLSAASARAECVSAFQRGDTNQDNKVDLSDPISTLGYLFLGSVEPGCHDAADADDNGKIDLSDAVYSVSYLFIGGAPIPPPVWNDCGVDPSADDLTCVVYAPCGVAEPGRCTSNDCCEPGNYCAKALNDCSGMGSCAPRPDICPLIFDPVCGCDGVTYSNLCSAASAGVNVVHKGECGRPEGCFSDDDCELGSFCERNAGECDEPGQCAARPEGCEKILDPVCGCDGNTYGNRCEAARQGVSVDYPGECRGGQPCDSNGQCAPNEYCWRDIGHCDDVGDCIRRPELCAQVIDPVCGCDGKTYVNDCVAGSLGVSLARKGPCEAGGECIDNSGCDEDSFCFKLQGFCNEPGFCLKDVDLAECAGVPFDPICGCDGLTHDNECLAHVAGVTVQRFGSCEEGVECKSNDDCAEDYFCFKKESFCAEPGFCFREPTPADCQDEEDFPVCGCDDATYRNECAANLAGVTVAYPGACDGLPRCDSDEDCDGRSFCQFRDGFCAGLGKCEARPAQCPEDVVDPVCGCDGITYINDCFARAAGVSVSFRGKCDGGNFDCQTSASCGQGLFCAKPTGDCDGNGRCDNLPTACDDVFDPVCGCDGLTYPNECQAHAAGVNVLTRGECP